MSLPEPSVSLKDFMKFMESRQQPEPEKPAPRPVFERVVLYRAWRVSLDAGYKYCLKAITRDFTWAFDGVTQATCTTGDPFSRSQDKGSVPHLDGGCGLYGFFSPERVSIQIGSSPSPGKGWALGAFEAWGRGLVCEYGMRVQYGRVIALAANSWFYEEMVRTGKGPEPILFRSIDEIRRFADEHRSGIGRSGDSGAGYGYSSRDFSGGRRASQGPGLNQSPCPCYTCQKRRAYQESALGNYGV